MLSYRSERLLQVVSYKLVSSDMMFFHSIHYGSLEFTTELYLVRLLCVDNSQAIL